MSRPPQRRTEPLSVDTIVDAACALIARDGLAKLSMRRLGAALEVDPMAVYHHVPNKRELLSLVTGRVVGAMELPAGDAPWHERVRGWARAYWQVVVANRDVVSAGLADPVVASGGMPLVAPLTEAVADSGIGHDLVEANVWLVVDFVHGAALGAAAPLRHADDDLTPLVQAFEAGLDTIVTGIAARASSGN
ncbi:MAG: TetR/AcrR family transcriptional regulator [Actinobacteria bacterium]|nr:TetR/AcrR family transcriptional regulator [Actinomycetota bacterium]